jgi:hypothetical protein
MLDIDELNARMNYRGGQRQESRMQQGKERSLKRSLIYSYQACTIQLSDGREFRALINPVKNSEDKDLKQISIPYKDICLNAPMAGKRSEGEQVIGLKPGDVFIWKETNTHWLVYLEHIEEDAYFRAYIIRCDQWIMVDDVKYWVHVRSSVETTLDWNIQHNVIRNNPNYHLIMYLTRNKQTDDYFHRFTKIKVGQVENTWEGGEHFKNWEVVGRNPYKGDGVMELYLKEDWSNTIAEEEEAAKAEAAANEEPQEQDPAAPYIDGPDEVEVYSVFTLELKNVDDFTQTWSINNTKKAMFVTSKTTQTTVDVKVLTGKSGTFTVSYGDLSKEIKVKSL